MRELPGSWPGLAPCTGATLAFDAENRLTSIPCTGGTFTAGYRGDNLRAWKNTPNGRMYFLYDGIQPVMELDSSGNVTAINTYGAAGLVSRYTNASVRTYYAFDNQGSVAERLDNSGAVINHSVYDAYGAFSSTASPTDPFGYEAQAGYFTDNETGLVALAFRYYDPSTGRFLNRDPIGMAGGINVYGYVGNGPSGGVDGTGLLPDVYRDSTCWGQISTHYYVRFGYGPGDTVGFWPGNSQDTFGAGFGWGGRGQYLCPDGNSPTEPGDVWQHYDDPAACARIRDWIDTCSRSGALDGPSPFSLVFNNCGSGAAHVVHDIGQIPDDPGPPSTDFVGPNMGVIVRPGRPPIYY